VVLLFPDHPVDLDLVMHTRANLEVVAVMDDVTGDLRPLGRLNIH
jgi:hypothetical protein